MIAELIGPNHESGALIYSFMSLVEKVMNGIIVSGVQSLASSDTLEECNVCTFFSSPFVSICLPFYTKVLVYVCGGATLIGILAMLSLSPIKIGRRYWRPEARNNTENIQPPPYHVNTQNMTEDEDPPCYHITTQL